CDIEFTIEKGKLWILQTRVGKRTAFAEWVMAHQMLEEGLIDEDTAIVRVDANRLEELCKRRVDAEGAERIAKGLNAAPGAGMGKVGCRSDEGDAEARGEEIWKAFERLMAIADGGRRLRVRANADTPDQSANARERGAEGIGLCRTEHMFLGTERVAAVQQMIFAESEDEEQAA